MPKLSLHFDEREFLCKCCGAGAGQISSYLMSLLEQMRQDFGRPIRIASGFRCPAHNAAVGGSDKSAHLTGEAADIVCIFAGDRYQLLEAAFSNGATRVGIGDSFLHLDTSRTLPQNVVWTYGGE